MKKFLFLYGTRPEAIKLAPLILELKKSSKHTCKVCVTGQHVDMVNQINDFFDIIPDYNLNVMKKNQDLFDITSNILSSIKLILDDFEPNYIIVQGDTTTVLAGSLAAFYKKIKIIHIEAGLRSHNNYSPFPEEINRKLTSMLTYCHFAPTKEAELNLRNENITENVFVVGNTVIDTLMIVKKRLENTSVDHYKNTFHFIDKNKKIILVTCHRRENFGSPLTDVCEALKILSTRDDVQIIFPVHPNPNVQNIVNSLLKNINNVFLIEPLNYIDLIWMMMKSYIIITDSGGIQEEAPTLSKPVLVLRNETERMEGVNAGVAKLVGTNRIKILENVQELLNDNLQYNKMASLSNPYGEGDASIRIVEILNNF